MALMWWEQGVWQMCMHHWTVYEKVDFSKFPPGIWGVYSTTFDPELRNEVTNFSYLGGFNQQPVVLYTHKHI